MQDAATSAAAEDASEIGPASTAMYRYLLYLGAMAALGLFLVNGGVGHDFFSQITQAGDPNWYRDFGGRHIPQIQDQDVFYSDVGHSVASAKAADIVFLGPSFVSYAVDRETLQSSPVLGQLKIYNMAFVGIRGGEFSRRIINRWDIRPPLWIINADDQFVHFFSDDLDVTIGPKKTPVAAIEHNWLRGHLAVVARNTRWRIEDWIAAVQGHHSPFVPFGLYRNVSNGDMLLAANPAYLASGNKPMRLARDPNCHADPAVLDYARNFIKEIGGNVVLMLVPHSQSCVGQAAELAKALNVELIAPPPFDRLTTIDGGGHLDKKGAEKFTSYLAAELVKTAAFKRAFAGRLGDRK